MDVIRILPKPVSRRQEHNHGGVQVSDYDDCVQPPVVIPRKIPFDPALSAPLEPDYSETSDEKLTTPNKHETIEAKDVQRLDNISRKRQEHVSQGSRSVSIRETQAREPPGTAIKHVETSTNESPHKTKRDDDDAMSFASVDSIELELLEFQQREAQICVDSEDWEGAEECITGILGNSFLSKSSKEEWKVKFAEVLCAREDWTSAISIIESVEGTSTKLDHLAAEAYLGVSQAERAKDHCTRAIKLKRKNKEHLETLSDSMDLMARIMDALGERVQAKFYRSKIQSSKEKETQAVDKSSRSPPKVERKSNLTAMIAMDLPETEWVLKWGNAMRDNDKDFAWGLLPDQITLLAKSTITFWVDRKYQGSALHIAAYYDRAGCTKKLIAHGADIHSSNDTHGGTPLHIAAIRGSINAAGVLLGAGSSQSTRDQNGDAPIHNAIKWKKSSMVGFLFENGGPHNAKDKRGHDLLQVAIRSGDKPTVKYLLDNNKYFSHRDSNGLSSMHIVAHNHQDAVPIAKVLCNIWDMLHWITEADDSMTVLHYAVRHGTPEFVSFLLDKGVSTRVTTKLTKRTPLHVVLQRTQRSERAYVKPIVAMLLEKGVDINAVDNLTQTALQMLDTFWEPEDRESAGESLLLKYGARKFK